MRSSSPRAASPSRPDEGVDLRRGVPHLHHLAADLPLDQRRRGALEEDLPRSIRITRSQSWDASSM